MTTPDRSTAASTVGLFWASGTDTTSIIGSALADQAPIYWNQASGTAFATGLSAPPQGATHLLVVADPENKVEQSDYTNDVAVLGVPLTVTINQASGQADPTNKSPINFTVVFNEPVSDFATGDVTLSSSTTGGILVDTVTGSGTTYNVAVSGMTGSGTVIASLAAGVAHDASDDPNLASINTDNSVIYDITPPTLTWGTPTPAANAAGWNNTNVSVPYTADDALSGVDTSLPASPLIVSAEGSNVTGTVTVTDMAGNSATFTSPAFNIDKTPPTLTWGTATPAANAAGWNNTNVSVPYTVADALSGVDTSQPASPLVVSAQGNAVTGTVTVTDVAGNSATFTSAAFKIDKTAPTLTWGTATPANAAGWNNTNVSVPYTAADALSGVSTSLPSSPLVLSAEGSNVTGTVTVTDIAGNSATFTSAAFKIDKTAPTLTWGTATPAANAAGWNNTNVSVPYTAADALSGVNTSLPSSPLVLSAEGSNVTGTVTVTDIAGNSATFTSAAFKIDKTAPDADLGHGNAGGKRSRVEQHERVGPVYGRRCAVGGEYQPTKQSAGAIGRRQQCHGYRDGYRHRRKQRHVYLGSVQDRQDGATVTINQASSQADPTSASPINFTVVFNEPVSDFATGDVTLSSSTAGGILVDTVTGSGTTYNVAVSGMTSSGTVIASLAAGVAHDAAGNSNTASTSDDNTVTYTYNSNSPVISSVVVVTAQGKMTWNCAGFRRRGKFQPDSGWNGREGLRSLYRRIRRELRRGFWNPLDWNPQLQNHCHRQAWELVAVHRHVRRGGQSRPDDQQRGSGDGTGENDVERAGFRRRGKFQPDSGWDDREGLRSLYRRIRRELRRGFWNPLDWNPQLYHYCH